jgi:TM2 domain-containing membrane protein YozV
MKAWSGPGPLSVQINRDSRRFFGMAEEIIEIKKGLSDHELAILNSELEKHKKSTGLTYVLWFFLGVLGIHKFYLGKTGMGIVYLILGIPVWISMFLPFAVVLAIPLVILLIIDLFTIPRQVRKAHEKAEARILAKIRKPAGSK